MSCSVRPTTVKISASILTVLLLTTAVGVFFTSDVAAQSDISVAIKGKRSTLLLAMKNNDDTPVYSVELKSKEGTIRFVKAKDWDRQKIDASTVMIQTDDKPITKGRTQIIILLMDNPFRGIEWKAFDIQHNLLQSDTEYISGTAKSFPMPPEGDKSKEIPKQAIVQWNCCLLYCNNNNIVVYSAIIISIMPIMGNRNL